jgi:thiosulfate reductase cytochrome b subunit
MLVGRSSWSQSVHFLSACVGVLNGRLYALSGLFTQHFRKNLLPVKADLAWGPIARGFESSAPQAADGRRVPYIALLRLAYLAVVFVFPLIILTGLASADSARLRHERPGAAHTARRSGSSTRGTPARV